jgi:hypothetical protein
MSRSTGQCPSDSFSLTFVHCCGHILLTGVQLISFFFRYNRNFKGGHFYAIGWYVHHLIARFLPWSLNLGHRPVLVKEFHSAPVHPPPSGLFPWSISVQGEGWDSTRGTSTVLLGLVVEHRLRFSGLAMAATHEEDGSAILKLQGGSPGLLL